ncbi:MAG: asparagine synthase (glutamine-hydrolyzing) [Planctomycetaceae bacterium]|nr:asparagine synthase (glutamine-hydrolyzing) [Planctomycetaceae bacterium]
MCGIAGFLATSHGAGPDVLSATAARMAQPLHHRGPDDGGVWVDAEAGIALGFRRLAILDLSPGGHQPMLSACGRYVVIFNGEIYNYRAIRKELEEQPAGPAPSFRGSSDTEILLVAICRWGLERAVRRFVGMFAFALWDRKERTLHLVRDRLGEKPLYYGWMGGTFLFGSELKALRAHPAFEGEVDRAALAAYVQHSYVPGPYCIYKGLRKLTPGTILTLGATRPGATPTPEPYWDARGVADAGMSAPFRGGEADAVDQLDRLLREAIAQQMIADVPLGAFLSGGIDSSTVVALMQAQSARPVETFTIGFRERGYDEAAQAEAVARHLGTRHTELYVTPGEAMGLIPALPALYDEPFADASQIPTSLVSRLARRSVTVSLSGDGGDELFAGYSRYRHIIRLWDRIKRIPMVSRRGIAAVLMAVPPAGWDRVLGMARPVLARGLGVSLDGERVHRLADLVARAEGPEDLYLKAVQTRCPDPSVLGATRPRMRITDRMAWTGFADPIHAMMLLDQITYLPDDILVKVDRASMGVSLESRAPFLDHRVVEFAWQLPMAMKVRGGRGKWLLRQVLYRYVPRDLVERPKIGFGVPLGAWLRGPLRDWAESLLEERRLRAEGYFDPAPIRQRWEEQLAGRRDWQRSLWPILMFQAWLGGARAGASSSGGADPARGHLGGAATPPVIEAYIDG